MRPIAGGWRSQCSKAIFCIGQIIRKVGGDSGAIWPKRAVAARGLPDAQELIVIGRQVVVIKAYTSGRILVIEKNETSRFPRIGSRLIASWGSGGGVGRFTDDYRTIAFYGFTAGKVNVCNKIIGMSGQTVASQEAEHVGCRYSHKDAGHRKRYDQFDQGKTLITDKRYISVDKR
jgi:hypothetical protein